MKKIKKKDYRSHKRKKNPILPLDRIKGREAYREGQGEKKS